MILNYSINNRDKSAQMWIGLVAVFANSLVRSTRTSLTSLLKLISFNFSLLTFQWNKSSRANDHCLENNWL